jgi:hypothetical protein
MKTLRFATIFLACGLAACAQPPAAAPGAMPTAAPAAAAAPPPAAPTSASAPAAPTAPVPPAAAAGPAPAADTPAAPSTPYAGQESRPIKALSPQDVQAYLEGKGMGLAKTAELNGYPGPAHVLALAAKLDLTMEQEQRTREINRQMEDKAVALGRQIVDEERALDALFAQQRVSPEPLAQALRRIGELQARLRQAHLEAHLTQTAILTVAQIAKYNVLRGYATASGAAPAAAPNAGHAGHGHHSPAGAPR